MSQTIHIRCDACGEETKHDRNDLRRAPGWMNAWPRDFCPGCWEQMMNAVGLKVEGNADMASLTEE